MPWFERIFAPLVLSSVFVWASAAAGLAAGNPGRQPSPTPPDVTVSCPQGFSAIAHVALNKEYTKVFVLSDGTVKLAINGDAVTTVSANGKVFSFNSSGPGAIYFFVDGSIRLVEEGHLFYIGANFQGMWVYTGLVVLDSSGNIVSQSGNVTDVCAMLA